MRSTRVGIIKCHRLLLCEKGGWDMGERFVNIDGAILEEFFLDSVDCIQDEEEVVKV